MDIVTATDGCRSTALRMVPRMISLTRLSGSVFALNSDLIERIDSTPDTVITLVDGSKYVVAESMTAVVSIIRHHRAELIALSGYVRIGEQTPEALGSARAALDVDLGEQLAGRRPALSVVAHHAPRAAETGPDAGLATGLDTGLDVGTDHSALAPLGPGATR